MADRVRPADLGLDQLFQHTREAIVVGNIETGHIALWNPAAERLFGHTAAEAIGQPIEILMPAPIASLHTAGLARYRRSRQGGLVNSGTPIEVPATTKDGREVRVELTLAQPNDSPAFSHYLIATLHDVSDRKRAEMLSVDAARAEAARLEAEKAIGQRDSLLRDGTLELQRLLAKLRRSTLRLNRLLNEGADGSAEQRLAALARVVDGRTENVERALKYIADNAAIQSGTFEIQTQRANLVPLVNRVVADARSRSGVHRMRLATPQGLTAPADTQRLEQVVRLLLEQACRRNPRGCWMDIELKRPLVGLARLEVRDYGRPLSAAQRARLVSPNGRDGWLTVCRYIVDKHGGTLNVEFPSEGGVRMVLTLPTQHGRVMPTAV